MLGTTISPTPSTTNMIQPPSGPPMTVSPQTPKPEMLFYEGSYVGYMPLKSGTIQTGAKAGQPWNRATFRFRGDDGYDKDFNTFVPLPGKTSLQAEALVNGTRYKVGYVQESYTADNGELRKSNKVIFIHVSTEQQPQAPTTTTNYTYTNTADAQVTIPLQSNAPVQQEPQMQVAQVETELMNEFQNDPSTVKNKVAWVQYYKDRCLLKNVYVPNESEVRAGFVWDSLLAKP